MKKLVYADAHELFCQYAFGGAHLDAGYTELTHKAIEYAQGVPLALKGIGAIKGISLNCPLYMFKANNEIESLNMFEVDNKIDINPCSFSNMNKLRFLKINGCRVKGMVFDLESAPFTEVRYLEWWRCPVRTLNIRAENLVSLQLPCSKVD
ncbi:hypothetical protein WN944_015379 [Citrus x changshan-huyou]|uniref:Uncharacterized protein n=1 Tax=Citrus x changshan-huyou TaxID=2935761 RepID=A0AAP0M7E9_9ROSI